MPTCPKRLKYILKKNLLDELKYFQKKYSCEIKILSNEKFIIPEYKINLLNKLKKPINSFENINTIKEVQKIKKSSNKERKGKPKTALKNKDKIKKN